MLSSRLLAFLLSAPSQAFREDKETQLEILGGGSPNNPTLHREPDPVGRP